MTTTRHSIVLKVPKTATGQDIKTFLSLISPESIDQAIADPDGQVVLVADWIDWAFDVLAPCDDGNRHD
jgi:hypothetical protein